MQEKPLKEKKASGMVTGNISKAHRLLVDNKLTKECLSVKIANYVSIFVLQGIAFLPSFVAWLQDFAAEGDGKSLSSLAMELKTLVKGLYMLV